MVSVKHKTALVLASIGTLLLGVVIYLPGLPGDFVFDDIGSIVKNPALRDDHGGFAGLLQTLLSAPVGGLLRPISTLTFALDARLFGFSPLAFKTTNILIHLTAGVMLLFVARECMKSYAARQHKQDDGAAVTWLSLAATALWLVHPLNLTSVLYTVQRDNALAALFTAAAITCYLIGRRRESRMGRGQILIWLCTPLFVVIGMLCKENAALTPVLLLVIEYTLLRFRGRDGTRSRGTYAFFATFLLVPAAAGIILMALKPGFFFAAYATRGFTPYERLLSESRFLLDYLRWIFVPDPRELGLFHDDMPISHGLLQPWTTLPSLLVVLSLIVAAIRWRRRWPLLSFGVLWFFAAHLMESTILPLELVFEHRNYVPSFGLILGCVGTLYPLATDAASRRLVAFGLTACVAILGLTTALRAQEWHSELSFARSEALHHPGSARAQSELQWAYTAYVLTTGDKSLMPAAVSAAEKSKALDPGSINQDVALAFTYAKLHDDAKALRYLKSAENRITAARATPTAQLALQSLLQLNDDSYEMLKPDINTLFQRALANPAFVRDSCYYGDVWNTYALFLQGGNEIPAALAAFHRAVTLCPKSPLMRVNFADMLLRYGDTHDAAVQIDALKKLRDLSSLPELYRLQQEYAAATATAVPPQTK